MELRLPPMAVKTLTQTHRHTHKLLRVWHPQMTPAFPFARFAMLLCAGQGYNSVLCLRAAVKATKLIRLPPGGRDDSLMTLSRHNLYTH